MLSHIPWRYLVRNVFYGQRFQWCIQHSLAQIRFSNTFWLLLLLVIIYFSLRLSKDELSQLDSFSPRIICFLPGPLSLKSLINVIVDPICSGVLKNLHHIDRYIFSVTAINEMDEDSFYFHFMDLQIIFQFLLELSASLWHC